LARAAHDDLLFVPQALFGPNNLTIQVVKVATTDIAEFNPIEIIPDALSGIEIRSIAWELFQMQAFGCASRQKVFDLLLLANRRLDGAPIPPMLSHFTSFCRDQ
jgi:hypothetical protein